MVADAYDLEFVTASNKGVDAPTRDGVKVEIKATQAKTVSFRSESQHVIVIKINKDGTFDVVYNGPGALISRHFRGKLLPSNGLYQISISKLRSLNQLVADHCRIQPVK